MEYERVAKNNSNGICVTKNKSRCLPRIKYAFGAAIFLFIWPWIVLTLFGESLSLCTQPLYSMKSIEEEVEPYQYHPPAGVNSSKIFAFIHTFPTNLDTRAKAVEKTWARRLDDYVFSTIEDKNNQLEKKWIISFSNLKHNRTDRIWLWDRVRAAFKKMYTEEIDNFDWFMKADDDTYYVVDNLRVLLSKYDPSEPWYLGELVQAMGQVYPSGGTGYVLSREALRRFISVIDDPSKCSTTTQEMEDMTIGRCFENAGLQLISATDDKGEHGMIPINLSELLPEELASVSNTRFWFTHHAHIPVKQGIACCSSNLIAIHYMSYTDMYLYDYLLYKVKVQTSENSDQIAK